MVGCPCEDVYLNVIRASYPKRPKGDTYHLEVWAIRYEGVGIPQIKEQWLVTGFTMRPKEGQRFLNPFDIMDEAKKLYLTTKEDGRETL